MGKDYILIRDQIEPHDGLSSHYSDDLQKGDKVAGVMGGRIVSLTVTHTALYGPGKFGVSAEDSEGTELHLLTDHREEFVDSRQGIHLVKLATGPQ